MATEKNARTAASVITAIPTLPAMAPAAWAMGVSLPLSSAIGTTPTITDVVTR